MPNPEITADWRSRDGDHNAHVLRVEHAALFTAISEVDALGHRVLTRAADAGPAIGMDRIVGLALLRRAVTIFAGIRHLLEASSAQPALLASRSQFEILLAIRYLVHGGRRRLSLEVPTNARMRETRARYYMAAAIRNGIYRRQAMLDGAEGASRVPGAQRRRTLENEVQSEINRLERHFSTQHRRYGALRCFPAADKKAHYYDQDAWYSFGFSKQKVNSVKALARVFGLLGQYFVFYGPLSDLSHAREVDPDLTIEGGRAGIHSPHDPTVFPLVAFWSCAWQKLALVFAGKAYCPAAHVDLQETAARTQPALDAIEAEASQIILG